MWNEPKTQEIGTSISTQNELLISYPSITVCTQSMELDDAMEYTFFDGQDQRPAVTPQAPDLSEFLRMIKVTNLDRTHRDITPSNSENRDVSSFITFAILKFKCYLHVHNNLH